MLKVSPGLGRLGALLPGGRFPQNLDFFGHRATRGQGLMRDFCSCPSVLCGLGVEWAPVGRASFWPTSLGPKGGTTHCLGGVPGTESHTAHTLS